MRAEELKSRQIAAAGWSLNVVSYRLGQTWRCTADNVSPGAVLARASGTTREEAEATAISRAEERLRHTKAGGDRSSR